MGTGWVAATVRAKALARRRLGPAGCRRIAAADGFADALALLPGTAYESAAKATSLRAAERAVAGVELWQLRVLAGWLPGSAVGLARALGARYELANVEAYARQLVDGAPREFFPLGSLALSWPRLATARSSDALRQALVASPWGDPGPNGEDLHDFLTARWLRMIAAEAEPVAAWATTAAALLAARLLLVARRPPPDRLVPAIDVLIGPGWTAATSVADLRRSLPSVCRSVFDDVDEPARLWRAEAALALRIESDGYRLLRQGTPGQEPVLGAVAVLAVDGWRLRAALNLAALRAGPGEVLDVVA